MIGKIERERELSREREKKRERRGGDSDVI